MIPTTEDSQQLFHGMRSKKSAEQIKKEGFCSYGSPVDEKKAIIDALKHFGKEIILHQQSRKGELVRSQINEITEKHGKGRLSTWATTEKDAPCNWWARANPEHISLALGHSGVSEKDTAKYLDDKYGKNCYNVELDLKSTEDIERRSKFGSSSINYNTNKNCIKPSEIKDVKKCKSCNYTYQSVEDNL